MMMRIISHTETPNNFFQLKVSGKGIDFKFAGGFKYLIAFYQQWDKTSVIQSIHNYLLDFFGNSVEYNWQATDIKWRREGFTPFIPKLENVSFCSRIQLGWDFKDMEKLENVFSSSHVFKSIQMNVMMATEPFNPESKFYQAESVEISQDKVTVPPVLRHFQGRQAIVDCLEHKTSDLIKFVNRWKSGEAFQKLEYLKIKMCKTPRNRFLDAIGLKHIDATKQPPTHTLPKVYNWYNENPNTEPITSHSYVVRVTDNHVASVLIHRNTLCFGVWDKTEQEFLRIMD
ncbi:hypothetical protein B9Z55_001435 [Caenorhabditis nigoni]|nr:hypothetical protein B9Z55_001435 [Caenorhabditis nigoni]